MASPARRSKAQKGHSANTIRPWNIAVPHSELRTDHPVSKSGARGSLVKSQRKLPDFQESGKGQKSGKFCYDEAEF